MDLRELKPQNKKTEGVDLCLYRIVGVECTYQVHRHYVIIDYCSMWSEEPCYDISYPENVFYSLWIRFP